MAETYEYLTDDDKNGIIENHLRNLEYSLFNTEMSILAAQSVPTPNAELITSLTDEKNDVKAKITALKALLSA
jgi:hypothetical protein